MRVESRLTSLSWIPSEAVKGALRAPFELGISSYDTPPPDAIDDESVLADAYHLRFANRLRAWAEFDGDRLVDSGVTGGVVMGVTAMRIGPVGASFAAVAMPDLRTEPEVGDGWVRFSQTCGGRTASPLPRRIARPPFVRMQAPLVWTTLSLTLYADGRVEPAMTGASPFPRHWVYGADGALLLKAGVADWREWTGQESWRRTPWGDEDSPVLVTAAETALERELSTRIMRGGAKPIIRELAAGDVLARQSDPGDSLYLLLDGVITVDVDGTQVAELGPGAVLGERALLEGGLRTSTLTAVTRIRVAEAQADQIDRAALSALAAGHRREDQPA